MLRWFLFCLSFLKMSNWCLSSTTPPIFRLIARALFWKIWSPSIRPSTCSWGLQVFWKRQRFHTEIIRASKSFVVLGGVAALPSTHSVLQLGKKAHLHSVEIAEIYSHHLANIMWNQTFLLLTNDVIDIMSSNVCQVRVDFSFFSHCDWSTKSIPLTHVTY